MANKTRQSFFVHQITATGGTPGVLYNLTLPRNTLCFSVHMFSNFPVGANTTFNTRSISGVYSALATITSGGTSNVTFPTRPISPECTIGFTPNGTDTTTLTVQVGLILED